MGTLTTLGFCRHSTPVLPDWSGMGTPTRLVWNGHSCQTGMEWALLPDWYGMGTPTRLVWNVTANWYIARQLFVRLRMRPGDSFMDLNALKLYIISALLYCILHGPGDR